MSSFARAGMSVAVALVVLAAPTAPVGAAEPKTKASPAVETRKSCGELPRGGRAYKDCIATQSRRDAAPAQASAKPNLTPR